MRALVTLLVSGLLAVPSSSLKTVTVTAYADVQLRYQLGRVVMDHLTLGRFARPTALNRFRGRFRARSLKGGQILETVQFDFPLVAEAEAPDDTTEEAKAVANRLRAGVTSSTTVRVPLPEGTDAVAIEDRDGKRLGRYALTGAPPGSDASAGALPKP
jgi:hypothetical protein